MAEAGQGIGAQAEALLDLEDNRVRTVRVWFWTLIRSRHVVLVAILGSVFLTLSDLSCILEDSISWWFMHAILFGFFYLFLQPWVRKLSRPWTGASNYINEWLASWIAFGTAYHLPSSHLVAVSLTMNPSFFLETFAVSILLLFVIHSIIEGCLYFSLTAGARRCPNKWIILKIPRNILLLSTGVSLACCTFVRRCRPPSEDSESTSDGQPQRPLEGISHIYVLWTLLVAIYLSNYLPKRLAEGNGDQARDQDGQRRPDFKDMVPWHSGTSIELYKTSFYLLISKKVFGGRFDMRALQAAINGAQHGPITGGQDGATLDDSSDNFSQKSELWFDFMADTGDGGNSTYTVAKLLAQPSICCCGPSDSDSRKNLPRGELLLIGGDIAYPHPSEETYRERLLDPFNYALQEPCSHEANEASHETPRCFIIPGNHDWFDGLDTFMGKICHGSWLGGWFMPQKKSYFALKLPKGWWVFGLDCALRQDIDVYQLEYFSKIANTEVGEHDSVIVITHQPDWLLNWYEDEKPKKNISELIWKVLKEKCKLRIAGDIHHYMHHSIKKTIGSTSSYEQHLLVNGCGGAFTHPTHVFEHLKIPDVDSFELKKEYPSFQTSRRLALLNIWNFRKENGQFDYVGGILYFILVFSMLPQCELEHMFQASIFVSLRRFPGTLWDAFIYMLDTSYVSLGGALLLLAVAVAFTHCKLPRWRRMLLGFLHAFAHLTVALILMLLLELGTEMLFPRNSLKSSDSGGLYQPYINYLLSALDVPKLMAEKRSNICTIEWKSISRMDVLLYRVSVFLCFWVLSTPFVSIVFGCYLYICVRFFNLHYDEAFSSLRIANYKAFTRFHIKRNGDLDVFTLAVDKVPEDWTEDDDWKNEPEVQNRLSHKRKSPSRWKAAPPYQDPVEAVKIIDQFTISGGRPSSSPDGNIVFGLSICATVVGNVLRRRSR